MLPHLVPPCSPGQRGWVTLPAPWLCDWRWNSKLEHHLAQDGEQRLFHPVSHHHPASTQHMRHVTAGGCKAHETAHPSLRNEGHTQREKGVAGAGIRLHGGGFSASRASPKVRALLIQVKRLCHHPDQMQFSPTQPVHDTSPPARHRTQHSGEEMYMWNSTWPSEM